MIPFYEWISLQATEWSSSFPLLGDIPSWVWLLLAALVPTLIAFLAIQGVAGGSTYIERKVAADIQRRVGPNQCNIGSFFGTVAREAIARGKAPGAKSGHKAAAGLFALILLPIDLIDKVVAKALPGVLIFLADGIKLIMKEDIIPSAADKPLFRLAPMIVLASAFGALAALPFSDRFFIADFRIGVFYILAITSIEAIGILMAGWASNNKWALLGGMRSAAQIVSYEIPIGIAILTAILLMGTMSMQEMTAYQFGDPSHLWLSGWAWQWNIFANPFMTILFPIYFLAGLAECNRTPFDIPEAESELVAGYHTEYTGMRFAFFFMAEYAMMCVVSGIAVTLFLGGWSTGIGFLETKVFLVDAAKPAEGFHWWATLIHFLTFIAKTYALVFVMMWIRWTIPRFRVDQMMTLCWKKLIPLTLFCFCGVAVWKVLRSWMLHRKWVTEDLLTTTTGWASFAVFLVIVGGLIFWFTRPLTLDDQEHRKLIARANIGEAGHGFA